MGKISCGSGFSWHREVNYKRYRSLFLSLSLSHCIKGCWFGRVVRLAGQVSDSQLPPRTRLLLHGLRLRRVCCVAPSYFLAASLYVLYVVCMVLYGKLKDLAEGDDDREVAFYSLFSWEQFHARETNRARV